MPLDVTEERSIISAEDNGVPYALGPKLSSGVLVRRVHGEIYTYRRSKGGILLQRITRWYSSSLCVNRRETAMTALQTRAGVLLTAYEAIAQRHQTWETMHLWSVTLINIFDASVQTDGDRLAKTIYAFLVLQAFATARSDPMLLFTPAVLEALQPLQDLLPDCQFQQTALIVFRLFWITFNNATYGSDEEAFKEAWWGLPWFGVRASLSGSQPLENTLELHLFQSTLAHITKEQLCSNASSTRGWKRQPPPYVDHVDMIVEYSNKVVSLPSLFAPLSLFMPRQQV